MAEKNFSSFYTAVSQQKENTPIDTSALDKLESIIASHPELHAKYDAPIAQLLLNIGDVKRAKPYITASLARIGREANEREQEYYNSYARTSLTMAEERYAEALVQAIALKEAMKPERDTEVKVFPSNDLYAFNLLRIAMLTEKTAAASSEELLAWNELKHEEGWNHRPTSHPSIALRSHFKEGNVSLLNYIDDYRNLK